MLTGLHEFNGQKMFFTTNGALRSNGKPSSWKKASGNWYYYDENGIPSLGKKNINGSIYCFNQEGVMQTGWVSVNGHGTIMQHLEPCRLAGLKIKRYGII